MPAVPEKTGKTETSYIAAYIQTEKPELQIRGTDSSGSIVLDRYEISDARITAQTSLQNITALHRCRTAKKETLPVFFKMKNKVFIFEIPVSGMRLDDKTGAVDIPVPAYFIKTKNSLQPDENSITFRFGSFYGYAGADGPYPPDILPTDKFNEIIRCQSKEWMNRTESAVCNSPVYSATGEILLVQPKIAAAAFVTDTFQADVSSGNVDFPQKNDRGTAVVKLGDRICPAESVCLKSIAAGSRLVAVFSLSFFHPEDTRFYFERFFYSPCPDSLISDNLTI